MSLNELQATIDASIRNASPLTRELFAEGHMNAEAVRDFVNRVMSASIATVGPAGRPHASLTLVACSNDGQIYFAANQRSALFRNLQRSPYVALTVDAQEHGLMAQGRAELAGFAADLRDSLIRQLDALMKRGRWAPADWEGAVFRVQLERIFAR